MASSCMELVASESLVLFRPVTSGLEVLGRPVPESALMPRWWAASWDRSRGVRGIDSPFDGVEQREVESSGGVSKSFRLAPLLALLYTLLDVFWPNRLTGGVSRSSSCTASRSRSTFLREFPTFLARAASTSRSMFICGSWPSSLAEAPRWTCSPGLELGLYIFRGRRDVEDGKTKEQSCTRQPRILTSSLAG